MGELLTHDQFADRVGDRFRVPFADGEALELELIEAERVGQPVPEVTSRHPFSLIFRGPASPFLPQANYRLDDPVLGPLVLLLVPVGRDPEGLLYQAIFA